MFALVLVSGLCYVFGGLGIVMLLLSPELMNSSSSPEAIISLLLVAVFFHALSKALDYLQAIRDALQKMATHK